jgi:hypothetical protein
VPQVIRGVPCIGVIGLYFLVGDLDPSVLVENLPTAVLVAGGAGGTVDGVAAALGAAGVGHHPFGLVDAIMDVGVRVVNHGKKPQDEEGGDARREVGREAQEKDHERKDSS